MTDPSASLLSEILGHGVLPSHVAIIMDGNGRWAQARALPRPAGHHAGMMAVREVVEGGLQAGVRALTLFAFSQENWQRPRAEIDALMELLRAYIVREADDLAASGVRVTFLGDLERLSPAEREAVAELEGRTRDQERLALNLCVSYGARAEIVRAARRLAEAVAAGTLRPEEITEARFAGQLYTAAWPDPDLLIRTSGEFRLSNFLLWQLAYAELHVTPVLWPDFTRLHLFEAIRDFQRRDRRFGRVAV